MKKLILALLLLVSLLFAKIETYTRNYTYYAGDEDSKNSSRAAALVQVKKLLLEEVGTYIESHSLVENNMLTKDEIIAICAGITKTEILKEDWNGKTYVMQAKIQLDPEGVQKRLNIIAQDQSKTRDLKEQYDKVQKALSDNEKLTKELESVKDELQKSKLAKEYKENSKTLSASESFYKGKKAFYEGDYDTAMKNFQESIDIDQKYAAAYNGLGAIYSSKGDDNMAIKFYLKAINLDTENVQAYDNLGFTYSKKGDYDTAIEFYLKALEVNPNNSTAYYGIGSMYSAKGDDVAAIEHLKKAIYLDPENENSYHHLGYIYLLKGEYDTAIEYLQKTIELNPKDADAYNNLGCAYGRKGNNKSADLYFKKAAQLGSLNAQDYCKKNNINW